MSLLYTPPPPPPPQLSQSFTTHGSIGAVIGVLAVVFVLCIGAVLIGRLCSGRGIRGRRSNYDMENWVETKCSSCVDGRIVLFRPPPSSPPPPIQPPPRQHPVTAAVEGGGEGTSGAGNEESPKENGGHDN